MSGENINNPVEDFLNSLLSKKKIILEVEIKTIEEAEEIVKWMYSKNPPLKSSLQSIHWDSKVISDKDYNFIQDIKRYFNDRS